MLGLVSALGLYLPWNTGSMTAFTQNTGGKGKKERREERKEKQGLKESKKKEVDKENSREKMKKKEKLWCASTGSRKI